MPPKCTAHQRLIAKVAAEAVAEHGWTFNATDRFKVSIQVHRARKIGDWDNFAKLVCDGMNGIVWDDDRHVIQAEVWIMDDKENPRTVVTVSRLSPATY